MSCKIFVMIVVFIKQNNIFFSHSFYLNPFCRSLDELIGRADLLRQRDTRLAKTSGLDLSFLTSFAGGWRKGRVLHKTEGWV